MACTLMRIVRFGRLSVRKTMSARPPPARPHIGLNPSSRFGAYSISDWGEDDAWDSGSDEESTSKSSWTQRPSTSTAPKPVPKPKQNSSTSTLASSYTHLNAPSPGSYPSQSDHGSSAKQGWTIVRTSTQSRRSIDRHDSDKPSEAREDPEVEGDLIVGEFDPEEHLEHIPPHSAKFKHGGGIIRQDVDEIVKGTFLCCQ